MKKFDVSVIVALYNTLPFLDSFFESLIQQDKGIFEVIIVDDVSTDGSLEYVQGKARSLPELNIRVFPSEKKLLPDLARKIAFEHCGGEYVIYLDSDDMFSPDYLSSLFDLAKANDLDMVVGSCRRIDETGKMRGKTRYLSKRSIPLMSDKQKNCLIRGRYGGWNRMARRSFLIEHGYDFLSAELPLYLLQFDKGARVGYAREACYYYRARGNSISRTKVPQRIADYDLLEPLRWLHKIELSKANKKALGLYLFRMILPYIYYKKSFVPEYDFKRDIKLVKKESGYSFGALIKYWWTLESRDKFMSLVFTLRMHWVAFYFIKKYRS